MSDQSLRLPLTARVRIWAAPHLLQWRDFAYECAQDIPLLTRIASHVGLLVLMVLTIVANNVPLDFGTNKGGPTILADTDAELIPILDLTPETFEVLGSTPLPITISPKRTRRDVVKYTVKPGDNVSNIAESFGVSLDSILWANGKLEDNPDMLSVGQILNIPPVSGVLVTVQNGDTVKTLATKYKPPKATVDQMIENIVSSEFNQERHDLAGPAPTLTVGQFLMIPGGYKPYVPRTVTAYSGPIPATAAKGTGSFGWPVSGRITQKYWMRHPGLDIGAPSGTPVYAADSGYVVSAGWSKVGYGNMILINHGNGYLTRYAHLSFLNVEVGDSVKKGQMIGRVGSTGNSTGPHLHFEIIRGGVHRNPYGLLPGK